MLRLSSGPKGITRVQSASGSTGTSSTTNTFTITLGANSTVGNVVIAVVNASINQALIISSSSFNLLQGMITVNNTGAINLRTYYIPCVNSGATALTFTTAGGNNSVMAGVAVEYSGFNIYPDQVSFGVTGNSASPTTGSITTLVNNELLVAAVGSRGTFASEQTAWLTSPTSSFSSVLQTSTHSVGTNLDKSVAFLERIVTSTGSFNTGGTITSAQWAGQTSSFYEVPPAPPNAFIG